MTDTLALENLFNTVAGRFTTEGTGAANLFGWRKTSQQLVGSRVVWVPGDLAGNAGELITARQPGRNPRPLATLDELFTVEITAVSDAADPENELKQYTATRFLYDAWYRAAYLAARGTIRVRNTAWVVDKKERRRYAMLRVLCAVEAMIPDTPVAVAFTDTRGAGDTSELDETDHYETAPPPPSVKAASSVALVLSGEQTVDDVALVAGDRVLAPSQGDLTECGSYEVAVGAWTRTADVLVHGFFVHVEAGGTVNGDSGFELITDDPIVVGTTPLAFARVSP